jgi:hypothetical protein
MATKNPEPSSSVKVEPIISNLSTSDVASFRAASEQGEVREFNQMEMIEEVGEGTLAVFESVDGEVVSIDLGEDPVRVCLWDSGGVPDPGSFSGVLEVFNTLTV